MSRISSAPRVLPSHCRLSVPTPCSAVQRDKRYEFKLWAGILAETEGFEPSIPLSGYAHLANECLQPLGHVSARAGEATRR